MALNLVEFYDYFKTEEDCINYFAKARWGDNPTCPHCNSGNPYKITSRNIFKCRACQKQFTVRIGTIFEESPLPLKKWFLAIYLLTSLKKGISSIQLAKYLDVTQKTAWFVLQRIRYALNHEKFNEPLKGVVEADETYVGGKRRGGKRGRGVDKPPVFGLLERKGKVKAQAVENVKRATLEPIIRENVVIGSTMMTDEFSVYQKLGLKYDHWVVNHGVKQYAIGNVHTNTLEGFWSHLKRGIYAIYLHVSKKHLQKYCDEFSYRYNTKEMNDDERFRSWFNSCHGRLTYQLLIAN